MNDPAMAHESRSEDEENGTRIGSILDEIVPPTVEYHSFTASRTDPGSGVRWRVKPVTLISNEVIETEGTGRAESAAGVVIEQLCTPPNILQPGPRIGYMDYDEISGVCGALKAFYSWATQRENRSFMPGDFVAVRETRDGIVFQIEEKDGRECCRIRLGPVDEWATVSPDFLDGVRRLLILSKQSIHRARRGALKASAEA